MRLLTEKVATAFPKPNKDLLYCLFDANYLPFEAGQFDVVIGNSVLHHFLNFEKTLKSANRVLRPGGVAVFGEPCMDSHVFTSMAARVIAETCIRNDNHPLSHYDLMIIEAISRIADQKSRNLNGPREHLAGVEDKFVFPSHRMHQLSNDLGFRSFQCYSPKVVNFSQVIKGQLSQFFVQQKIDLAKLDHFDYVFESIGSTYEAGMAGSLKMPFSFFLFTK
jgi:ubiquinone/menaquinone biosynthesis C-methylase UbiE